MVDVFISYARENQAMVRILADAVRREGYRVWWDDDIPPHLAYGDVISEKIGAAKAAIVVWSADAAASEWVRAEADVARGQKKLIQTSIDGREPPMPFNQIQVAGIGDWRGEDDHPGWRRVRQSLAALCGPADTTVATAPPITVRPPDPPPPMPRPRKAKPGGLVVFLAVGATLILVSIAVYVWSMSRIPGPDDEAYASAASGNGSAVAASAGAGQTEGPAPAPMPPSAAFTQQATVEDPAGFANVRSGPTPLSPIVGRVDRGETVLTYPQTGDWWQVRTRENLFGYLHRPQLRIAAPPAATAQAPQPATPVPTPSPQAVAQADADAEAVRANANAARREFNRAQQLAAQGALSPAELEAARTRRDAAVARERAAIQPVAGQRRYCAGAGRNTPQCRQMRQRSAKRGY